MENNKPYGIIYRAYNIISEKCYIGKTTKTLSKRISGHYSSENCIHMHRALMIYPKETWEWKIIDIGNNAEDLANKEKFWIKFYNARINGYNCTDGGEGSEGVIVSKEHKFKTRNTLLEKTELNWRSPRKMASRPVRCIETGEKFFSASDASRKTGITSSGISAVCRGANKTSGGYHWEFLKGKEALEMLPNAIYCVELNRYYDNVREACNQERFHATNLGKTLKKGDPYEPKEYAGYTFYWVNPQYHLSE